MRAILVTWLAALLVVGTACDRDERAAPTSAPTPTVVATATLPPVGALAPPPFSVGVPMPPPLAAAPPRSLPPDARPPAGAALIDLASGAVTVLYEGETYAHAPRFETDGSIWLNLSRIGEWRHFDAEGSLLETRRTSPEHWCPQAGNPDFGVRFTTGGREHEGLCITIAPDGRHAFYSVSVATSPDADPVFGPASEAWLLRVSDGTRTRLTGQPGFVRQHEGVPSGTWSSSGRYLIFDETDLIPAHERRPARPITTQVRYLVDTETGTVTVLAGEGGYLWSAREDAFARGGVQPTELVRLPSAATIAIPDVPWHADFDNSGRYVYTAERYMQRVPGAEDTVVADVRTGMVVARWRGTATGVSHFQDRPVGFVRINVLDERGPCRNGTVIHHPLLGGGERCMTDGYPVAWKPDASALVYTRDARPGPKPVPYERDPYSEVVLLDVQSGQERRLFGSVERSPNVRWRADGAKILVSWPRPDGMCTLGPPDFLC